MSAVTERPSPLRPLRPEDVLGDTQPRRGFAVPGTANRCDLDFTAFRVWDEANPAHVLFSYARARGQVLPPPRARPNNARVIRYTFDESFFKTRRLACKFVVPLPLSLTAFIDVTHTGRRSTSGAWTHRRTGRWSTCRRCAWWSGTTCTTRCCAATTSRTAPSTRRASTTSGSSPTTSRPSPLPRVCPTHHTTPHSAVLVFFMLFGCKCTVEEMLDNPYAMSSDSFYFLGDELILHHKAFYAFTRTP